jgi:four helix bundle protein
MPTFRRFEDIDAWQKARELTRAVYAASNRGAFERDVGLRDQIRRASVSVMSNIAEGFDRSGNREFTHFLSLAKGSVAEVRSQLYVALDAGYLEQEAFDELAESAAQTSRLIGGLMKYLRQSNHRGAKFKDRDD